MKISDLLAELLARALVRLLVGALTSAKSDCLDLQKHPRARAMKKNYRRFFALVSAPTMTHLD